MSSVIERAIASLSPEQQSEWADLQSGARDPLDTLSAWTPEHRLAITRAWSNWAREQTDARFVLRTIAAWSLRLAVLLACRVAREALRYVPTSELRPLRAVETAERWVRGRATGEECRRAANAADAAADAAAADDTPYAAAAVYAVAAKSAAHAAYAATYAATYDDAADAACAAAFAVADATYAATYSAANWDAAYSAELRRLCFVIADDLLSGRSADWIR
jgi:hypothetical protein